MDLLRLPSKIIQIAQLLGAIGPFPASVSFRELPSASGLFRTRGGHRMEGVFLVRDNLGEIIIYREREGGWIY